jgi:hypothetical protein
MRSPSKQFNRIVILQNKSQAKRYHDKLKQKGDLIYPIGASSIFFCIENNLEFITEKDFIDKKKYKEESLKFNINLKNLIKDLNEYSRQKKPSLDLDIGDYFSFQLYIILGQISFNEFIISSLKKKFLEINILVFKNKNKSRFLRLRPDPTSLLAEVLEKSDLFDSENINIIPEKKQYIFYFSPESIKYILRYMRDTFRLFNLRNFFSRKNKKIAIIGGAYDWFKLAKNKRVINTLSLSLLRIKNPNPSNGKDKEILEILKKAYFGKGKSFIDLSFLSHEIKKYLEYFARKTNNFEKIINRFYCVATGVLTWPEENFLAHIAIKNNKRVILWQHGERGQSPDPSIEFTEMLYTTDLLTYGSSVDNFYKNWLYKNNLTSIKSIGSLTKQVRWKKNDSKNILYATGKWHKNAIPFLNVLDSDIRLVRAHLKILGYLNNIENWNTIFKTNNTKGLNEIPYKNKFNNIKFESNIPFTDLLKNSELVILDTPSTTLIEACSTSIPIFVLSGRNVYSEEFLEKVSRRVIWCNSLDELISNLNNYLKYEQYDSDLFDESFVNSYFSKSSENLIAKKIINLIENPNE